jgi:hypothetical protein
MMIDHVAIACRDVEAQREIRYQDTDFLQALPGNASGSTESEN